MCENLFFKSKFQYFIFNEYFHVWDKSGEVSTWTGSYSVGYHEIA